VTQEDRDKYKRIKANFKLYKNGKTDFSIEEFSDLKIYLLKYKDTLQTTLFYEGLLKEYKIVSCFAEQFYEELQEHMINKFGAAIVIVVLLKDKKIFFKKNPKTCSLDLCVLAKLLSDGGCVESTTNIAEGNITEKFLNLTKTFKPCT
jgi:hypothetical protein